MKRVLVVDDDHDIRVTISEALRDEGYVVVEAENGQMALDALAREQVHAVLLDLMMPSMDGPAFLRALEAKGAGEQVPVILMTASRPAAFPPGVSRMLHKPISLESLLAAIVSVGVEGSEQPAVRES